MLENIESTIEDAAMKEIIDELPTTLDETTKEQVIKSRIGQNIFKNKLLRMDCHCKICGIKNKALLIASHIKPWKNATNKERLDPYNGFLLCPSHDALFDKGLISFADDGRILISSAIDQDTLDRLHTARDIQIDLLGNHKPYLAWHRQKVFQGDHSVQKMEVERENL